MANQRDNLTLTDRELLYRLGWFTRVRWALGLFALLLLVAGWYVIGIRYQSPNGQVTMGPAARVILLIFLYNAAFTFIAHILQRRGAASRRIVVTLALGQIVCDMVAICGVAHFSGGIENFFIILILVPLVIATTLLPRSLAYTAAAAAAALINLMAWSEQQGLLPHIRVVWPGATATVEPFYMAPRYVIEATGALTTVIFATVFIASSISRRLRARETELEQAYERLSLADEAKSFFMRKAGHDMRAPLAAIHSVLAAIEHTGDDLSPRHRQLIARAMTRAQGMITMVDELRKYSQLRARGSMLSTARTDLGAIVTETVQLFRQQAEQAEVELACTAGTVTLPADAGLLREVITNLVSNALQYTPRGGKIDVTLAREPAAAVLTVADTGMGISEQDARELFEEYYRSNDARRLFPEGTGMGLAICRQIVRMHGGRIDAAPRTGGGTIFTVRLPLSGPPADESANPARPGGPAMRET